jgi:hypothetical protein
MQSITIDKRYCGPPNSANGGYVCGLMANALGGCAEITLRSPPPLGLPLELIRGADGSVELRNGEAVLATGKSAWLELTEIPTASLEEAMDAVRRSPFADPSTHELAGCFVCGPARAAGDGLRIFAGPLPRSPSRNVDALAAPWVPASDLAGEDGRIAPEFVWAALDCPSGYACFGTPDLESGGDKIMLLGRMTARIEQCPCPGDQCIIVAWPTGRDGRKLFANSALMGPGGNVLAIASATWLIVDRRVLLRR